MQSWCFPSTDSSAETHLARIGYGAIRLWLQSSPSPLTAKALNLAISKAFAQPWLKFRADPDTRHQTPDTPMKNIPYQIVVAWSDEDEGYVARVPALRYCLAFGETPEKAVKEVKAAAAEVIKVMKVEGKPLPAVDITLDRVKALQPLLNMSAVAKAAKMSVQTLSTKITRGTAFTQAEASRIGKVLTAHGVPAI